MSAPETAAVEKPFALVGYVATPREIVAVCDALREEGYRCFDAHTPFPVHGLERAMGLPASPLPWITLGAAILGAASALLLQWWTSAVDYPLNIGGKPLFSLPAFIPVTFELTVLFAAIATFLGNWGLSRLPRYVHAVPRHTEFGRASDDLFFVSVEATDPRFDPVRTRNLLAQAGTRDIQEVSL